MLFLALQILNPKHFIFDGVPTDQFVAEHQLVLANAVHPVYCLSLDRRIPPGIHDVHVVCAHQVQADAAGAKGDI
jgi:hypothetical protein